MKNLVFVFTFSIALGFFGSKPSDVFGQDEFERVQVLDNPRYSLNQRVHLDFELTYLPLDAYYKPVVADLALHYQFGDFLSWEVARFGYSITNYDTGLNATIASAANTQIDEIYRTQANDVPASQRLSVGAITNNDLKDFKFRAGSALFANLLYSKSNFFNRAVVYHYWQAGLGASYWDFDREKQYGIDFIIRARFFLTEHLMTNIRIAHFFGFNSDAPQNIMSLGLGGGYAF